MNNEIKSWRLDEWTGVSERVTPMSSEEIREATKYLRENHYPKPEDCPMENCPGYRPACILGICHVATRLTGDF